MNMHYSLAQIAMVKVATSNGPQCRTIHQGSDKQTNNEASRLTDKVQCS